jgi:translation initiation factor 5A
MADEHDVHFESADAGASLTFPQQAGTIRKNGFIVIKNRPCKVSCQRRSPKARTVSNVPPAHLHHLCGLMESCAAARHRPSALRLHSCMTRIRCVPQVVDVSTSKTGKHGHAKCHFVALDIFTGKKLEDLQPSSHNSDVSHVF